MVLGADGGSDGLAEFLNEHGEALESDFQRFESGLDLRDIFKPEGGPSRLTPRRFWTLVSRLPDESAYMAERAAQAWQDRKDGEPEPDDEAPAWRTWYGRDRLWDLLADHFDLTHAIGAGGSRKQPSPYPREPAKQAKPRVLRPDEIGPDLFKT